MQFTELMLLHTTPLFWEVSPSSYAQQLKELLLDMLDPGRPGRGTLLAQDASGWREDDNAVKWINSTYEHVWLEGASKLEAGGDGVSKNVFNLYAKHKANVFLDDERLKDYLKDQLK